MRADTSTFQLRDASQVGMYLGTAHRYTEYGKVQTYLSTRESKYRVECILANTGLNVYWLIQG